MAPLKFADFAKDANDLFKKDFPAGTTALSVKSTTSTGVSINVDGNKVGNDVSCSVETKYTHKASDITVREKWATSGVETELSTSSVLPGTKLSLTGMFNPNKGITGATVKVDRVGNSYTFGSKFNVLARNVALDASFAPMDNYLAGASATADLKSSSVTGYSVGGAFIDNEVAITASLTEASDLCGSLYHAPTNDVATAVKFSWNKAKAKTGFAIAAKFDLDSDTFVKAKVDKELNLGLGYSQRFRTGVNLVLGCQYNPNVAANNQVGLKFSIQN